MKEAAPADRYARASAAARHPMTAAFAASERFDLDPFQIEACEALEDGRSVLVAAPTGAGKTVVAEFAVHMALARPHGRVFYTAPIKALSNQKFREFAARYGEEAVGLLTGDTSVNPSARVVVMTTEVLRNMLYGKRDAIGDLRYVVMDEVHYLADRFRGAVWEEVIIHLPRTVGLISLSATVSNAEEFGEWLGTVRGDTAVIVSESRPVPLEQHALLGGDLVPLFDPRAEADHARVNPLLGRRHPDQRGRGRREAERGGRRRRPHPAAPTRQAERTAPDRVDRAQLIALLERSRLLPAIVFVFSRKGCDAAVRQVRRSGMWLTDPDERIEIRRIVTARTRGMPEEDLAVLGFWEWRESLERGIAAHHAGLLPAFKEIVEELFQRKLVKAVFATETLALGVNMPARTVVLEKLEKFNGQARVPITAGEYTQLTGRAGRRGIDVEGHAVVLWNEQLDAEAVAALASRRTYPLNSSFLPTYNMAVNLVDRFGRARARSILESSFAQFQADRAVMGLAEQIRDAESSLAGYAEAATCDRGDIREYLRRRNELASLERGEGRSGADGGAARARIASARRGVQQHPCHSCPDRAQHERWARRAEKLEDSVRGMRAQVESRTGGIARRFDRVLEVLGDLDYVRGAGEELALTAAGRTMQRIYGERDLLVAESLRTRLWEDLDAAELASLVSALVYEPRREDDRAPAPRLPARLSRALVATEDLRQLLSERERARRLPTTDPLAGGLCLTVLAWARGGVLERVLVDTDLAAGDFVRWCKQTIDLLDQIADVAVEDLAATARDASRSMLRGIVAYSSV